MDYVICTCRYRFWVKLVYENTKKYTSAVRSKFSARHLFEKNSSIIKPTINRVLTGRPGGVSGYPRAWYRSVLWVRAPPSASFSCAQIDFRKARERELATFIRWTIDEQWDCWTLCAIKVEGKNRGGEGMTPVTTACPEAGKWKCAEEKKKKKKRVHDPVVRDK